MKKRLLSALLVLCMMLTLLPATASAAGIDTAEALQSALDAGGTVTLGANITGNFTVKTGKSVTLNLNGKTLTNSTGDTITVEYGASLFITGKGTVDNKTHAKAAIFNNGTVVLIGLIASYPFVLLLILLPIDTDEKILTCIFQLL